MGRKIEPEMLSYLAAIDKALAETSASRDLLEEVENGKMIVERINSGLEELSRISNEALLVVGRSPGNDRAGRMAKNVSTEREQREQREQRKKEGGVLGYVFPLGRE